MRTVQRYSVEDAAAFLEFDAKTIEYWLRMGHLTGDWNTSRDCWEISPQSIVDFLRQAREPMPTGAGHRRRGPQVASQPLAD